MHRVHQDEATAELAGPFGDGAQIVQIAHAPGFSRTRGIQLGHQAPGTTARHAFGQAEERRRHHEYTVLLQHQLAIAGITSRMKFVPTQRQRGIGFEGRLAHEPSVDLTRLGPVLHLAQRHPPARFEFEPDVDGRAGRHVHQHALGAALGGDHRMRNHPTPRPVVHTIPARCQTGFG